MVLTVIDKVGAGVLRATDTFGDFAVLAGRAFAAIFKRPFDGKNLLNQFQSVGVNSIPVVVLTSLAVSMVFAVQLAFGFRQSWNVIESSGNFLVGLVSGRASSDQLSGPVGIAKMSGEVAKLGLGALIGFAGLLSVSIGLLNLMPVPLLDGGHLVLRDSGFDALLLLD